MTDKVRKALEPVLHWYQSDEEHDRPTEDIIKDVVADLQQDREQALLLHRIVLAHRELCGDDVTDAMPKFWGLIRIAASMFPNPKDARDG